MTSFYLEEFTIARPRTPPPQPNNCAHQYKSGTLNNNGRLQLPRTHQPRLNLFKGNYGKISEDMQSIDWDTTLQSQPFIAAYRVFCNIIKEKTEQHIPITTKQKKIKPLYHPESKEPTHNNEGQLGPIHKIQQPSGLCKIGTTTKSTQRSNSTTQNMFQT